MDESLRWLIANGMVERATWVIKKAARINKVNEHEALALLNGNTPQEHLLNTKTESHDDTFLPMTTNKDRQSVKSMNLDKHTRKAKRYTALDIFRNKHLLVISFICWFTWYVLIE